MLQKIAQVVTTIGVFAAAIIQMVGFTGTALADFGAANVLGGLQYIGYDVAVVLGLLHLHFNQSFFGITINSDQPGPH